MDSEKGRLLMEFKAGKCVQEGKKVKPLTTKGMIQVRRRGSKVIFSWQSRDKGSEGSETFEFGMKEGNFRQIGNPSGRVFLLENLLTNDKHFFWMQDADESADAFVTKKLKGYLSDPSPPAIPKLFPPRGEEMEPSPRDLPLAATLSSPHSPHPAAGLATGLQNSRLSGLSALSSSDDGKQNVAAPNLLVPQNFLQQILQSTLAQMGVGKDEITLEDIFQNVQDIFPVLNDPVVQEELLPLLPSSLQTQAELFETLNSPQFHQSLTAIEAILHSDQLAILLTSTGISLDGMSAPYGTLAFLNAIQKDAEKKSQKKE